MPFAWRKHLWIALGLLLVSLASIHLADESVARFMHGHRGWSTTAAWIAELGDSLYWFIAFGVGFLGFHLRRAHDAARWCFLALASLALSGVVSGILKATLARWRPRAFVADGAFTGESGFAFPAFIVEHVRNSYPSGHATTAFTLAALATIKWPRWTGFWVACGSIVALSRVVQNSHWLGDMLAGSALGWVAPWIVMAVWRARWPASAPRQRSGTTA
jgi:membrane-associated phospholipid phosphatase